MVGSGGSENNTAPPIQPQSQQQFQNHDANASINSNQWGWPRRGLNMRGGYYPGPWRGMYMGAGAYFPGPRGMPPLIPMPPQQPYYNQRKSRPQWSSRPPRPQFAPIGWMPTGQEGDDNKSDIVPRNKSSRKSQSESTRPWNREAAVKALEVEAEYQKNAAANSIIVRFPDPELSNEIVQKFHPAIENVFFQAPCGARYCFVTLNKDADVDQVISSLNKVKFGVGTLHAERKVQKSEDGPVGPENIDPFSLYVGNLPLKIHMSEVKEKFPTAIRIDVGHAQKMKKTRYAFMRYATTEAALEAYKASVNLQFASRSVIIRFRRNNAPVGPPGEKQSNTTVDPNAASKLTVGEKLKAKREKLKQQNDGDTKEPKAKKRKYNSSQKEPKDIDGDNDQSSDDEIVELESDNSHSDEDVTEEEASDDDEDDEEPDDDDDDDDDDDLDDEVKDDDDDDDEPDEDDHYDDDDYQEDLFNVDKQINSINENVDDF